VPESVKHSFENHFMPFLKQYDIHSWRIDRYYNEYVDNTIKAYLPIFDAVFRSQAPQKIVGKKESNWMWLDEFTQICLSIIDKEFPVREIPVCFNISMKLQTNEIDSERHYNMHFSEFLEAIARVIDKLSPIPPGENMVK
jgi:hypothetical protein